MLSVREHIYRLNCLDFVEFRHKLDVARLGGGITTDINYFLRPHCKDLIYNFIMHAIPRGICYDDIRPAIGFKEFTIKDFRNITGMKCDISNAI